MEYPFKSRYGEDIVCMWSIENDKRQFFYSTGCWENLQTVSYSNLKTHCEKICTEWN